MNFARLKYNFRYAVHWRKPKLTLRIIKNFIDHLVFRKQPLRYIDVNIGLACNLKCSYCFSENFKYKGAKELSVEEWKDTIEQCIDLGAMAIGFTGGEPLVYPKLFDIIKASHPEKMLIIICTNGLLLTPDQAKKLYDAGVDIVQMSMDSGSAEDHDAFAAQQGAFEKAKQAFDIGREAGLDVAAVPTVSHYNMRSEGFKKLVEWSQKENILVNLSMAAPVGGWAGNEECLLDKEDIEYLNHLVKTTPNIRRDFETNYYHMGCGASTEKLYFTPYGDVIPCPYMHIAFGNVRELSVKEIRDKMLDNKYLTGFHPICLVAEDREFIRKYLPQELLKDTPLPRSEDVFEIEQESA
jgi:MoaA/NifB/PqqE/SkfB family radical SAM enzyme